MNNNKHRNYTSPTTRSINIQKTIPRSTGKTVSQSRNRKYEMGKDTISRGRGSVFVNTLDNK
jgi:hypothetical protein